MQSIGNKAVTGNTLWNKDFGRIFWERTRVLGCGCAKKRRRTVPITGQGT